MTASYLVTQHVIQLLLKDGYQKGVELHRTGYHTIKLSYIKYNEETMQIIQNVKLKKEMSKH